MSLAAAQMPRSEIIRHTILLCRIGVRIGATPGSSTDGRRALYLQPSRYRHEGGEGAKSGELQIRTPVPHLQSPRNVHQTWFACLAGFLAFIFVDREIRHGFPVTL